MLTQYEQLEVLEYVLEQMEVDSDLAEEILDYWSYVQDENHGNECSVFELNIKDMVEEFTNWETLDDEHPVKLWKLRITIDGEPIDW